MFRNANPELTAALEQINRSLDLLDRRAEQMETILMVREPASVAAADAYEGLRKQVVSAVSERLSHLSQLVQLDHALRNGADGAVLRQMTDGWFEQAGLERVTDPDHPQAEVIYELLEDEGGPLQVVEPGYLDRLNGRIIRPGRALRGAPGPRHRHPEPAEAQPAAVPAHEETR